MCLHAWLFFIVLYPIVLLPCTGKDQAAIASASLSIQSTPTAQLIGKLTLFCGMMCCLVLKSKIAISMIFNWNCNVIF